MQAPVVLCADSESLRNPGLIGLEGERLEAQPWLRVFCSAIEARSYLQAAHPVSEVWVASSDEVHPINLAAALKKDSPARDICLLAFQGSGSLKSRANAAGLDVTFTRQDFVKRYGWAKRHYSMDGQEAPYTMPSPTMRRNTSGAGLWQPQAASVSAAHPDVQKGDGGIRKMGHIISVVSATGGSGKSTVAALAALFAQGLGNQTLLLDADLQFGDMRYILGEENPLTVDALLGDPRKMAKLKPDGLRPALLAAPDRLEQSEAIAHQLSALLEHLRTAFDVIVVNTGAFWTEQHAALLERSSTALFLIDQRASSLRACKHAIDLCTRCGIATHPFIFAVNRCTRNAPLSSIDVSCALQGAHVFELQDGGRDVGELLGAGIPFDLINTRNNLCLSIESMLIGLLPQTESPKRTKESTGKQKRFRLGRKRGKAACL